MKEVKLTEKEFMDIKSNSVNKWVKGRLSETSLVEAVINSFIAHCNYKGYVIKDGKVLLNEENRP